MSRPDEAQPLSARFQERADKNIKEIRASRPRERLTFRAPKARMLGIPFLDDAITKWFKPQTFDDPVDRLNYFITSTLLAFFAIMVSAKQYVGSPIQCWMPMEFRSGWEQYAEDYCFIQNTYFKQFGEEIPTDVEERQKTQIGYYQWVPIVLAIQAILFYLPNWLWKTLHQFSGLDLNSVLAESIKLRSLHSAERKKEVQKLATYIEESLEFAESPRSSGRFFLCFRVGRFLGSYVTMLYLVVKVLYVINVFGQLIIINNFIGADHALWGFTTARDLWNGEDWSTSGVFPRVTLCDFKVRRLANIHRYTVQCVLMINMFNEKIYLFLWFWMLFVAVVTLTNTLYLFIALMSRRMNRVKDWLNAPIGDDMTDNYQSQSLVRSFTNALKPDGALTLRFVDGHAGALVARDLTMRLYGDFVEHVAYPAASTKSTSPGAEDGHQETLYNPKMGLMAPDYPVKQRI